MTSSRARLPLLACLITVLMLAFGAAVAQADTLDQQQTEAITAQTIAGPSNAFPVSEAQTFTAGLSGWVDRVQLYLSGSGNSGPLTVEITNTSGGAPGTTVLASTSVPAAAISSTGGWVEADFSSPAPVSSGTQYAIVAYADGSDVYGWYAGGGTAYAGGGAYYDSASPPTSWTANPSFDLAFMTYVESSPPGTLTRSPNLLTFATQAQTTVSAPQTVTITNSGASGSELDVSGFAFTGDDPDDFLISSENCGAPIPAGGSCQVAVRFAPEADGARTAYLDIYSNDPSSPAIVTLLGTGGDLPQGATGPQGTAGTTGATGTNGMPGTTGSTGATGAQGVGTTGPAGPAGQAGAPGKIDLVVCKTVTRHNKKQVQCAGRLVSGTFALSGANLAQATLRRGDAHYATGERLDLGGGRSELVLADLRAVPAGRYTLTLRYRSGRRWVTSNRRITVN